MPTLLAAVGTSPDAAYPSDGEDLEQVLTGRAGAHSRKFCWRYKAGSQRAIRDGDRKYLRIAGSEFLFDVVRDPRERANLKDREKDVFRTAEKGLGGLGRDDAARTVATSAL